MSLERKVRLMVSALGIVLAIVMLNGGVHAQAQACPADKQPCHGECIEESYICILEPWPGMPKYMPPAAANAPLGPFLYYVNSGVWPWIFKMGVAIAILNGVFGGFQIVMSNGDSGKIDEGKNRFIWSAVGLILLLLSGTILHFLNPVGFAS